jgi:hypothetical protein
VTLNTARTILWILCAAVYMPHDYRLIFPAIGILVELRDWLAPK